MHTWNPALELCETEFTKCVKLHIGVILHLIEMLVFQDTVGVLTVQCSVTPASRKKGKVSKSLSQRSVQ